MTKYIFQKIIFLLRYKTRIPNSGKLIFCPCTPIYNTYICRANNFLGAFSVVGLVLVRMTYVVTVLCRLRLMVLKIVVKPFRILTLESVKNLHKSCKNLLFQLSSSTASVQPCKMAITDFFFSLRAKHAIFLVHSWTECSVHHDVFTAFVQIFHGFKSWYLKRFYNNL